MMPQWLQKEIYVAVHGQTAKFRIFKWIIILIILYLLFTWKGWSAVTWVIILGAILGITMHMFLRYKTNAWTKSWGKVKAIKTPFDN